MSIAEGRKFLMVVSFSDFCRVSRPLEEVMHFLEYPNDYNLIELPSLAYDHSSKLSTPWRSKTYCFYY